MDSGRDRGMDSGPHLPDFGIPPRLARRMTMAEQHEYLRTKLTRRRALVTAGALAGGGLLAGCASGTTSDTKSPSATATGLVHGSAITPFGRHLAFGADPKTQMRISWQVPLAVRKPYIRVGLAPWDLSRKIDAELRDLHTPGLTGVRLALDQYYLHAALDGLRPGTTYYYGVGHEGLDPAGKERRSAVGSFRTAPATSPDRFVFTAFGDQGVTPDALANDKLILGRRPAFHLHAGDICYADVTGHGEKSDSYDPGAWDLFLKQTESVAKSVPWMVTTGNHDMEAWYSPNGYGGQSARWTLPGNGFDARNAPGAYSFTYGNVGIVALDANDVSYEIPANKGYSSGRQTAWLDKRLGDLRKSVDFVVVFFHHCTYSTSSHASDGGVRDAWLPLFTKHQVDLVINGHNHVYERTDAIKGGKVGRPVPVGGSTDPTRDGIVYVTAGGAGQSLYSFPAGVKDSYEGKVADRESVDTFHWTKSQDRQAETVEWSRVRYTGYSFLSVEAESGAAPRLKVSALAQSGRRVDYFEVRRGA
ncbi:purple acid phosphatase family protein [Streptomyces sp. NPDC087263]|uniref:purple acid phosphatase family protein n=1 Tax=Streptomyces sp. NPDC087263 TaxID=3365773 RepID=UPI003808C7A6